MSARRAALVNVLASLGLAVVVGVGVWLAGGPAWAIVGFMALTYLHAVANPSAAVREGLAKGRRL